MAARAAPRAVRLTILADDRLEELAREASVEKRRTVTKSEMTAAALEHAAAHKAAVFKLLD